MSTLDSLSGFLGTLMLLLIPPRVEKNINEGSYVFIWIVLEYWRSNILCDEGWLGDTRL